jgi:hypothetical protein
MDRQEATAVIKATLTILAQQWGSTLAIPFFLLDRDGNLLFYNEPAEPVLGRRFDETGVILTSELATLFQTTDADGAPVPNEALPIVTALTQRRPAARSFWICGLDQVRRYLRTFAFPLLTPDGQHLGAVALFWEIPAEDAA